MRVARIDRPTTHHKTPHPPPLQHNSTQEGSHPKMRLFLTSDPSTTIPIGILSRCIKLSNEPPAGTLGFTCIYIFMSVCVCRLICVYTCLYLVRLVGAAFLDLPHQACTNEPPAGTCVSYGGVFLCILCGGLVKATPSTGAPSLVQPHPPVFCSHHNGTDSTPPLQKAQGSRRT